VFGIGKSLVGALLGGQQEHKQVNDMRDQFIAAAGGLDALNKKAHAAGLTLDQLLNAKKVDTFNAAVAQLNGQFDLQGQAQKELQSAIDKYGISIDELGPKFAQQKLDEQAQSLLKSWDLLSAAGVSYDPLIQKMGPDLTAYVQQAISAGSTIPESFRPVIEQMIQHGELLDENGEAYTSAEDAGVTFAQSMTEAMAASTKATLDLVNAIRQLFGMSGQSVDIPINFPTAGGEDGGGHGPGPLHAAGGAFVTSWGVPAVLHGTPSNPEFVARHEELRALIAQAMSAAGGGGQAGGAPIVIHNHTHMDGKEATRVITRRIATGQGRNKQPLRGRAR